MNAVKYGTDWDLENQATALLLKDRKDRGLRSQRVITDDEYNWLTEYQLQARTDNEVYTSIGSPDPNILEGRVFRAYNPLFGKRPRRSETANW